MAKTDAVLDMLTKGGAHPDKLSYSKGIFTAKFGFFYRHGGSSERCAEKVMKAIPGARVIENFEAWKAWPKDSYWIVKFEVPNIEGKSGLKIRRKK